MATSGTLRIDRARTSTTIRG